MKCDILNGTWQWPSSTCLLYDNADFLHSISCCSVSSPDPVTTFLRVKFGRRREKRGVTRWWRAGGGLRITDSWTMRDKPQISRHRTFARFLGNIISSPALLPRQLTVKKIISTAENKQNCSFYMRCCTSIDWIVFGFQQHCPLYFET